MKILVTGSRGMVGSNIIEHPSAFRYEILSPTSKELNLLDAISVQSYIDKIKPDMVVHAAGIVGGIQTNMAQPVRFLVDNMYMGLNILIASKNCGIKRFMNLSSSCMYPHDAKNPLSEDLILRGKVDIVKCGIGPGSACLTRTQTGVGIPQLSAIMECADAAHGVNGYIIGDGGITCPGDMSKAFCGGADFVMMGGQFAGHDENPGEIIEEAGKKYKLFYGMSSETAMNTHYGEMNKYRSSEGRTIQIKYKGKLEDTVLNYLGGVRSTCTYMNAQSIKNMGKCCTFVRVNRQLNTIYA